MSNVTVGPPLALTVPGAVVNGAVRCREVMAGFHSRSIALAVAGDLIRGKANWLCRKTMHGVGGQVRRLRAVAPAHGAGGSIVTDLTSWIAGLMRENYEAVGFLPFSSVRDQYLAHDRYVLQTDERGRKVGYLLHGAPQAGHSLNVAQHCIQVDRRSHGYGELALAELVERAERAGCTAIRLRCATDLESLGFWQRQGFQMRDVVAGGKRRDRTIARLWLPLRLPLFGSEVRS